MRKYRLACAQTKESFLKLKFRYQQLEFQKQRQYICITMNNEWAFK